MQRLIPTLLLLFLLFSLGNSQGPGEKGPAKSSAKAALLEAFSEEGKGCHVYGKIKFVDNFADYQVKFVDHHEDLKVEYVGNFADEPGKWEIVEHHEDYSIEVVEHHEDFTVKEVDNFPGCD